MSEKKINKEVIVKRLGEIRAKKAEAVRAANSMRFQLERIEEHVKHLSGAESILAELVGEQPEDVS